MQQIKQSNFNDVNKNQEEIWLEKKYLKDFQIPCALKSDTVKNIMHCTELKPLKIENSL